MGPFWGSQNMAREVPLAVSLNKVWLKVLNVVNFTLCLWLVCHINSCRPVYERLLIDAGLSELVCRYRAIPVCTNIYETNLVWQTYCQSIGVVAEFVRKLRFRRGFRIWMWIEQFFLRSVELLVWTSWVYWGYHVMIKQMSGKWFIFWQSKPGETTCGVVGVLFTASTIYSYQAFRHHDDAV